MEGGVLPSDETKHLFYFVSFNDESLTEDKSFEHLPT